MSSLEVKVTSKTVGGSEFWEGTINVPGLRPTKLVRRSDNSTTFATRSALMGSARNFAKGLGYTDVVETSRATAAKKTTAASKSKSIKAKSTKTQTPIV